MLRFLAALALAVSTSLPAQSADHPLQVGGDVKPPIAIHTPDGHYTKTMLKEKTSSPVVALLVDEQGVPRDVHILRSSGSSDFDQATVEAVAHYRFKPARLRGMPVAVLLNVEVNINTF